MEVIRIPRCRLLLTNEEQQAVALVGPGGRVHGPVVVRLNQEAPMPSTRVYNSRQSKGCNGTLRALPTCEEMIKNLECHVCFNIPIPPIIHCKKGHITCAPCRSQLRYCGLCNRGFTTRNFPLETILNSSMFSCTFEEDGCTEEIRGEFFFNHTKICKFRNVICTESIHKSCEFYSVPYGQYWEHLQNDHQVPTQTASFNDYTIIDLLIPTSAEGKKNTSVDKYCIEIADMDHKFVLRSKYSKGYFKFWMSNFGEVTPEDIFKATIYVGRMTDGESKISWTMLISSFRKNCDEVEEIGTIVESYLRKLSENTGNGTYKVRLFCKIEDMRRNEDYNED